MLPSARRARGPNSSAAGLVPERTPCSHDPSPPLACVASGTSPLARRAARWREARLGRPNHEAAISAPRMHWWLSEAGLPPLHVRESDLGRAGLRSGRLFKLCPVTLPILVGRE